MLFSQEFCCFKDYILILASVTFRLDRASKPLCRAVRIVEVLTNEAGARLRIREQAKKHERTGGEIPLVRSLTLEPLARTAAYLP